MKIIVLGDAHLISDADPYKRLHSRRDFFKSSWPSFQRLLVKVNQESPDLSILLGDLVDWFSPENISFGLDLLSQLRHPWFMTPGNHDVAAPAGGFDQDAYKTEASRDYCAFWKQQKVDMTDRVIDIEGCQLILLDSALSNLADGSQRWLSEALSADKHNFLFTHVPIDTPQIRDYIFSVDPNRSMVKYVLSGAPGLYQDLLKDRVAHVFSGHLHFGGDLSTDTTRFHLCNMSISMTDPNRQQNAVASATVIEGIDDTLTFRHITVSADSP
ncbi:MAG: metallophosphoesterase [bacterium]|nr:metallophosphoesterase [bacterium]